jgi:hypothetical protein
MELDDIWYQFVTSSAFLIHALTFQLDTNNVQHNKINVHNKRDRM